MSRPRPSFLIALALAGALGFVVLRVLYRAVFGGASSGELQLWSLPRIRLSGPFSHIVLFGPVTMEGVLAAAWSALPFAAVILATGFVVALIDVRSLVFLIPRVRWGTATFIAFVIALATLPTLMETARRTSYFARIRGISKRRVLFVPFLEKTLERSVGIAKALHTRGVVVSEPRISPPSDHVALFENFAIHSRGVSGVSWSIPASSFTLLMGETGAGKTSLMEACAGVLDYPHPVSTSGTILVSQDSPRIGYVPHNPQNLFLAGRVRDEIALGLVIRGVLRQEALDVANQALAKWEIEHLAESHPGDLSEGEATLVALASAMVLSPRLLLLDEPLAVLDRARRDQVVTALAHYVEVSGAAVLMTDHGHVSPTTWPGRVVHLSPEGISAGPYSSPAGILAPRIEVLRPESDAVFSVDSLQVVRGDREILTEVSLEILRGQSIVIIGDNGVGKTTLLEALLEHSGFNTAHVAYVPTRPADLFITQSLSEELSYTDRHLGLPEGFTRATLESLLPGAWRDEVLERAWDTHPRDLSRGQQTALAIALQMSHKPLVLALDEPTRGLDQGAKAALSEVLACVQETGTAIISASHADDFVSGDHDRVYRLREGSVIALDGGVLHA